MSGNLLQIMKVCENLKLAIEELPSHQGHGDPSAVLRSSTTLYTVMHINEIVALELFKALNHFLTWIVTVGQSKTSPMLNWWVDNHPPHSFEYFSLLEEGPSSLKDQSHCLILKKSSPASPEW